MARLPIVPSHPLPPERPRGEWREERRLRTDVYVERPGETLPDNPGASRQPDYVVPEQTTYRWQDAPRDSVSTDKQQDVVLPAPPDVPPAAETMPQGEDIPLPPARPPSDNPFDQFDTTEEAPPVPLTERMRLGAVEGYARGSIAGSSGMAASQRARQDEDLVARSRAETARYNNPSPEPLDGETRYEAAIRSRAAQRRQRDGITAQNPFDVWDNVREDLLRYEAMPSASGPLEMAATGVGMIAGGMMSPESWILRVPGANYAAGKLGFTVGTTASQIAEAAIAQGLINMGTDPVVQGLSMLGNTQQHYDPVRTLLAGPIGAVVGGGLAGAGILAGKAASAIGDRIARRSPTERIIDPTPEDIRVGEIVQSDRAQVAAADPAMRGPNDVEPPPAQPPASLRNALARVDRPVLIPGMEGERVPDPVASDLLRAKELEGAATFLSDNGVKIQGPLPDAHGASSVVLDAGSDVVRLGRGGVREYPDVPFVAKPRLSQEIGDVRVEVLPKLETKNISEADVAAMKAEAERAGYRWDDAGTDNLGRAPDGKLYIIDGNLAPLPRDAATTPAAASAEMPARPQLGEQVGPPVDPMRMPTTERAATAAATARDTPAEALPRFGAGDVSPPSVPGDSAGVFMFDAPSLRVDAERFQFKAGGDESGVTARLKGVTRWDPAKANQVIVWQDNAGQLFVVDGHQRTALARRLIADGKEERIEIPGILYREADGISSDDVRAIAAAKNLSEGSGSALDGAKVLRSKPELLDGSLPLTEGKTRQAVNLARLDDEAFRMVVNEVVPENYGAVVGEIIPTDAARQIAAIKAIAKFEPRNVEEATALVQRVQQAELARQAASSQGSLFGDTMAADSTAGEEMRIVARVIKDASKDRALLARVVDNASRIEQTGSTIEREAAQAMAGDSALVAKMMATEAYSAGPVRDALLEAARNVKAGNQTLADAARDVFAAVRRKAEDDVRARTSDSGGSAEAADATDGEGILFHRRKPVKSDLGDLLDAPQLEAQRAELRSLIAAKAPKEAFVNHPLIVAAAAEAAARPETRFLPGYGTPEFEAARRFNGPTGEIVGYDAAAAHLTEVARSYAPGGVKRENRAVIVMGPPAAGKSSIAEDIARRHGFAIIDSDDAKKIIPEFDRGIGAAAVHEESTALANRAADILLDEGDNVLYPRVGGNPESLARDIALLKEAGYKVDVLHILVDADEAMRRMVGRFLATGRLIPPPYLITQLDRTRPSFHVLKEKGVANAFAEIDLNGPPGTQRVVDGETNLVAPGTEGPGRSDGRGDAPNALGGYREAQSEAGAEGLPQLLIDGVKPVTDKQRLDLMAAAPLRGGNRDLPANGLFGDTDKQGLLFRRATPGAAGPPNSPPVTTAAAAASGPGATPAAGGPSPEVISLQEQSLRLAEVLGMPLREGRVQGGKDALGQYDTRQGVARARAIASFETVAHEAGHDLEKKIGGELSNRITAARPELGPLDYDATRLSPREGFAEFLRLYLTNPAAAQRAAPQFMNDFRTFMSAEHPEILAALDQAQAAHTAYINAPSDVRLDAIVQRTEPETIARSIREDGFAKTVSLMVARAYEGIFDDKAPVTRAVRDLARMARDASGVRLKLEGTDNPENVARLFIRNAQAGIRDMMDGVRPYHQIVPKGPALRDALITATGEPGIFGRWNDPKLKDFSNYLVAVRGEYMWRKFKAGLIPRRPLAMSHADTIAAVDAFEAANPTFRAAADQVHAYTRELLTKQYEGGLIGAELFEKLMKEEFYVPLFRDMRDKPFPGGDPFVKSSADKAAAQTVHRFKGSDRDIVDPIQGIMTQTFLVNRTLAHNDIIHSFVNLARQAQRAGAVGTGRILEEVPAKELVGKQFNLREVLKAAAKQNGIDETDTQVLLSAITDVFGEDPILGTIFRQEPAGKRGEPIVFYKEGGDMRAVRLISKEEGVGLYEALAELPPQLRDWAVQLGSASAQALRLGITTNPVFAFTNFIRDQLAATILRPDYVPFNPRGLVREARQDRIAQMYNYSGGVSPGAGSAGLDDFIKGDLEALARKGWAVQKLGGLKDLATRGDIKAGAKAIGETVEIAEAGTRLNVMKTVFDQKKRQGLSDYDAMIEAASQATDLMDFGRHGSGTQTIRALVPFLNAHLQGLDKARRTLVEPVTRALRGDMVTEADVKALKNAGLAWTKMAGVGGALGFAYGMYASQHDAYRDANDQLRATHLVLPGGPFGFDGKVLVIPKPFELAIGFNLGELAAQHVATGDPRVAGFAGEGVREVMAPPNVLSSIPIIKTFAELALNRSFFTGRDIVPERLQRLTPSEQYTERTSQLARTVGGALNVSPVKIDYAIGSAFGLWGRDLLAASNATDPNAPGAALEDQVFFRRFIKNASSSSETLKRFWDMAAAQNGKFAQAKNTYEDMLGRFRDGDAARFLGKLATPERAYVTLNSAADENGKLKFSADEKRLHPLTRAAEAVRALNGYVQELQGNAQKDIATGQQVAIDPQKRRQLIDAIRVLSAMEQRNALTIMKEKGYEDRKVISTADQLATIRAIDARVADEIAARYAMQKIAPTAAIARAWPEAQRRLLQDGSQADLRDLAMDAKADGYEFGADRVSRPARRRVPIPAAGAALSP